MVLNWNHTDDTLACVRRLQAWQHPPEIYIADNGSHGNAVARLKEALPNVCVIANQANLGFGGGNNAALTQIVAAGSPAFVLLLNNDAELSEDTIQTLLQSLTAHTNIAILGTVIQDSPSGQSNAPAFFTSYGGKDVVRWIDTRNHEQPTNTSDNLFDVPYVPATAAVMRTQALQQVGLLDPGFFFSIEMADWCYRARQLGWRTCIHLGACVQHDVGRSSAMRNTLHAYYSVRNRFLFLRKHAYPRKWLWGWMWVWRGLYATATSLVFGQWLRARALLAAVWHGLAGKAGMAPNWLQPK